MAQEFEHTDGESKKSLINHYPLLKNPDFLKYVRISLAIAAYFLIHWSLYLINITMYI